jgi:hypothetical protein
MELKEPQQLIPTSMGWQGENQTARNIRIASRLTTEL